MDEPVPADNRLRALRKKDQKKEQETRQTRKGLENKDTSDEMLMREAESLEKRQ
ncbi:uncharacterized protein BO95DRAFT_445385 [Aspergillus brunneoviolaceus CBS 621.78]|uniref:Uncharacterized protein n=1 Tax=Aspergillus brunneoviolaceus CBS 621.78 TaxID=1450534 RepID=A0ACD1G1V3_9EURO|nr:hypothetical protein BO95DRAFT_445385 [Aspergillus brunneoviolaceus CBS 621.78]RAH43230.1 hypothetical protein BO95DRAFT_445385 [Aspergillus brunneoviolaceus CBS 621.78]